MSIKLKLSPLDSPARTLVSQEIKQALGENDLDSGLKSSELLATLDQNTLSWRMSQTCLLALLEGQEDGSGEYLATWPRSGLMRNGIAYLLPQLVRLAGETASSLLPSPSAREGKDWSKLKILASLDRGDGVAKRICALSETTRLSEEIGGLNPSFGEWMQGFPAGWTD